jgi:SNF2 family DNA or RNA helicase
MWWNQPKMAQAIARVIRRGQTRDVDVYFFTSNTGIEKALFQKQMDKIVLTDEIKRGKIKTSVRTLKMEEILRLIDCNENYEYLVKMY